MDVIKLALVDDHPLFLEGLEHALSQYPEVQLHWIAGSVAECQNKIKDNPPDVLLLDLNLPDGHGADLCLEILQAYPATKIIALSSYDQPQIVRRLEQAGAHAYVLKSSDTHTIMKAVKLTLMGGKLFPEKSELKTQARNKQHHAFQTQVTKREKDILRCIINELNTREIAEKLSISEATVETHRSHLLQKLQVKNTAGLVRESIRLGIVDDAS